MASIGFIVIINGLVLGMVLSLVALGLSIIFGTMGIVNFAHGSFVLLGAYLAWWINGLTGNFVVSIIIVPLIVGGIGIVIEQTLLKRLYGSDPLLQLLLTFGLAEIFRELVQVIWGVQSKFINVPGWGAGQVNLYFFDYPMYSLVVLVLAVVVVVTTYLFLNQTKTGITIQAGSHNREMVGALGINIERIFTIVFCLGAVIAGLAGVLIAPMRSVYPNLGIELLIPSFAIVIIGGLGNFLGTVVAGLVVGMTVVVTSVYAGSLSNASILVLMGIVLIANPTNIYEKR